MTRAYSSVTSGRKGVAAVRIAFGVLASIALVVGYDRDIHTGYTVDFWFYFTNLSNIFGATVLITGGVRTLRGRDGVSAHLRGSAVLYLVITGLVYWLLLASQTTPATIKWQNDVVHGVMPVFILLDWLVLAPTSRVSLAKASRWLAFPLLYLAVSLIRGPIVKWWPYDFLDPTQPGGYSHVTTWSIIVTGIFVFFMFVLVLAGNQLGSRRSASSASASPDSSSVDDVPSSERNLSSRSA